MKVKVIQSYFTDTEVKTLFCKPTSKLIILPRRYLAVPGPEADSNETNVSKFYAQWPT